MFVTCLFCRRVNVEGTERCIGRHESLTHYIAEPKEP